jgi:hypothetical protein
MVVAQVEVGVVVQVLGRRADGVHDREAGREVAGADAGLEATEQVDPPVEPFVGDLLSGQSGHEIHSSLTAAESSRPPSG